MKLEIVIPHLVGHDFFNDFCCPWEFIDQDCSKLVDWSNPKEYDHDGEIIYLSSEDPQLHEKLETIAQILQNTLIFNGFMSDDPTGEYAQAYDTIEKWLAEMKSST